jgi:hypothetical protein
MEEECVNLGSFNNMLEKSTMNDELEQQ